MKRQIINPWAWQDQYGFVQANEVSEAKRFLFISGQASADADGKPVHKGNMPAQVKQSLDNLETVLRSAGLKFSNIVRLRFYTTDVDRFLEAHGATVKRLEEAGCRAASTLLGVARLAFPELLVEIDADAAE